MKSTGLFGKNSGRIGGVVYFNYRGQQVVRAYQPQVKNPNTLGQQAQRAKFKLVSQVSAALGSQIRLSFVSNKQRESNRNAFIKHMLKKATYVNAKASLPIDEIVITNSQEEWIVSIDDLANNVSGTLSNRFLGTDNVHVRAVFIGYDENESIVLLDVKEQAASLDPTTNTMRFSIAKPRTLPYSTKRVLLYAYQYDKESVSFEDYETESDDATLEAITKYVSMPLQFSATVNRELLENV